MAWPHLGPDEGGNLLKNQRLDVFYGSGGDHVFLEKVTALAANDLVFN